MSARAERLKGHIAYCEAAIRHMTECPASEPDQAAQDKRDLAAAERWLTELRRELAEIRTGRRDD